MLNSKSYQHNILFICDNSELQQLDTMAKLCFPYSSSPPTYSFSDFGPISFPDEFCTSADTFDLLESMPSIHSDIQKFESDHYNDTYGVASMDLDEIDVKPEVCNTDLMWSAPNSKILSTSASSVSSDIVSVAPPSAVMGHAHRPLQQQQLQQQQQHRPQPTVVTAKKFNSMGEILHIKQEQDLEQHLEPHSIPNTKVQLTTTNIQNIPAGTSLLRNNKKLQQNRNNNTSSSLRTALNSTCLSPSSVSSLSSLNISNCSSNSSSSIYQRPDTPHSLDDDSSVPDFRHNVDLGACIVGSNKISLTPDHHANFISNISQELQDTSKKQIDTRLISGCSLTEVLDVINSNITDLTTLSTSTTTTTKSSATTTSPSSTTTTIHNGNSSSSTRFFDYDSDEEDSTASMSDHEVVFGGAAASPVSSQSSNIGSSTHNYMQHSDHSYTRSKDGMDDISTNLETPSDSGELVKSNIFFLVALFLFIFFLFIS